MATTAIAAPAPTRTMGWRHRGPNPGRGGAYSAFIADHTAISLKRYNYVWRLHETPVVPEPATILMLGAGSLGAFYLRRRRCRPGAN